MSSGSRHTFKDFGFDGHACTRVCSIAWSHACNRCCREKLTAAVSEAMAGAASTAKGGFVRDALVGSYPRLAALLEESLTKLQRDTDVRTF